MSDWINFSIVISGQFLILLGLAFMRRIGVSQFSIILWRSMLLGLPLGFLFDILIGQSQAVFFYSGVPDSWVFTAINGLFSYGFAIASASLLPVHLEQHHSARLRKTGTILCVLSLSVAILISAVTMLLSQSVALSTLLMMIISGLLLVLSSEGLALWSGYTGPVYAILLRQYRPIILLWLACVGIGALYELLNYLFPLWHWQEARNMLHWQLELIIIIFGYFTLFLPMLILSRLFISGKR